MPNTVSVSQRLKLSLSMNCLNNSVSSFAPDEVRDPVQLALSMSLVTRQRILDLHRSVPLPVRQILGVQDLGPCDLSGLDDQGIPE